MYACPSIYLYIYTYAYVAVCKYIYIYIAVSADEETTIETQILQPIRKDLADTVKRLRHATRSAGELLAQANQFHRPQGKIGVVPKIRFLFGILQFRCRNINQNTQGRMILRIMQTHD